MITRSPTLKTAMKALRQDEPRHAVSSDELQLAIASGLLHDLWTAARALTMLGAKREEFRRVLGLNWQGDLTPTTFGSEIKPFSDPNPNWRLVYDVQEQIEGVYDPAEWRLRQPKPVGGEKLDITQLVHLARHKGFACGQRRLEWLLRSKEQIPEKWKRCTPEDRGERDGTVYHKEILAPGTLWFHPEWGWYVPALSFTVTNPQTAAPWNDAWTILGVPINQTFIHQKHYVLAPAGASSAN